VGGGNQALPDGLRLAGDVVGGGDLRHGADLVLERAAGTQVVAGQARGHVHVQREPDNGGVEPGQLDVRPVRVALEGATFAALAAAGTLWGTSVPQTRLALSLAGVWLVAAGGGGGTTLAGDGLVLGVAGLLGLVHGGAGPGCCPAATRSP
jgi:hypothetical protein